jgi:hypothetical protein
LSRKKSSVGPPQTREELIQWLRTLQDQVLSLRLNQQIFKSVWHLIETNPELQARQSHLYGWIHNMYAEGMAMAVRRLCDSDERTISLVRFLTFVKSDPTVISRNAYAALFPEDTINHPALPKEVRLALRNHVINTGYDKLVGENAAAPDKRQLGKEIGELKRLAATIIGYAHKRIAHHDVDPPKSFPTLEEIDSVIDLAAKIIQKYLALFEAVHNEMDSVVMQYDWMAPLRVPWLVLTQKPPESR